jgi:two-component system response regulator DctR
MTARICLVDDDENVRHALEALFRSRRLRISTYDDPLRFLSIWKTSEMREVATVILMDVRMPGASGLEIFREMKEYGLPDHNVVMFLSGHGDIPLAVEAIKEGATDFLEKPFADNSLVDRVLHNADRAESVFSGSNRLHQLLAQLSDRELKVAGMVSRGMTNRSIAEELSLSVRTVEVHRARVFEKLNVRNAVELQVFAPLLTKSA